MPRPRPTRALAAGIAVLVIIAARPIAAQSSVSQTASPEVKELSISGVRHVSKGELQKSIATGATSCKSFLLEPFCIFSKSPVFAQKKYLDQLEFERDVLRIKVFYWKRGYRHTQVDTTVTRKGNGVKVHFAITEGRPTLVDELSIAQAEQVLDPRDIRQSMVLHRGAPLDLLRLDSSVAHLRGRLWDRGYADAVLNDTSLVAPGNSSAAVRISIEPRRRATIDTIIVRGNSKITRRTIGNMLAVKQGGVFRHIDVLDSQRNLYASSLFRRAVINAGPPSDSAKTIVVDVEEAPFHMVRVSGGFNTVDFGQIEGRFTDFSWLGGARRLELNGVLSNIFAPQLNGAAIFQNVTGNLSNREAAPYLRLEYEASAQITQPWWHDPRNTLGAALFSHRNSAPAIFIDKGYGGNVSFTRDLEYRTPLSVVYQYELTEVTAGNIYFCVNYGVCEAPTISALAGRHALSPFSADLYTDRRNDPLSPSTGYTARLTFEHASALTLSQFRYNRISGEASRYIPIGRSVLAGRVRFGWVKSLASTGNALGQLGDTNSAGIIHPRKRFYAGGANSVRGYGENQLGPRVLTVDPDTLIKYGCTEATIANGTCSPANVPSEDFSPQPTGGTSLIEGNIELRFPIWKQLGGAVFIDGAFVGEGPLAEVTKGTGALTPGFGFRYASPVGPIRIDLGIRPALVEDLRVITDIVQANGTAHLVELDPVKAYDPLQGPGGGFRKFLRRLALHLSIGQAF
jgi:outer membrane protein insertion porin family/translocation and assembly module TamA